MIYVIFVDFSCPGHEEYPKKFDVDMETQMLGTVKPYRRQACSHKIHFVDLSYRFCLGSDIDREIGLGKGGY
jgi:hypothetical protein